MAEQYTNGPCVRCKKNPAVFFPTKICRDCHALFSRIPGPDKIGYEERRKQVDLFFRGE